MELASVFFDFQERLINNVTRMQQLLRSGNVLLMSSIL